MILVQAYLVNSKSPGLEISFRIISNYSTPPPSPKKRLLLVFSIKHKAAKKKGHTEMLLLETQSICYNGHLFKKKNHE